MPFKEATFWIGLTALGLGPYFWVEGGAKVPSGIAITIFGVIAVLYAIVSHYWSLPKIKLWVALLFVTWAAISYDIFDRYHPGFNPLWPACVFGLSVIGLVVGTWLQKRQEASDGLTRTRSTSIEQLQSPNSLQQRIFELATRYKKAAREFHKQNPQPPAPPALTAWITKANGWQKVNFLPELERAHDELEAEGLSDVLLEVALASTPTLDRVEQITQRLRFLAAQLDDDPGDYQNVRMPEIKEHSTSAPDASWVRFLTAYPEIAGPPQPGKEPAKKPQKIRCEFFNCMEFSYKVKMISWDCGSHGLPADFWRGCLQLHIGTSWCPEWNGVEELHVPPGESFRVWLYPREPLSDNLFKERVNSVNLGTIHLLVNGKEIAVSVAKSL